MKNGKFTTQELLAKIDYEGGIGGALGYGIEADDIDDEKLAELWRRVEGPYNELQDYLSELQDEFEEEELD